MGNQKLVFQKNADKKLNRIIIPKFLLSKMGTDFIWKSTKNT